jgi:two-component system alkaline phosphatase synthesis response regulator PhoP
MPHQTILVVDDEVRILEVVRDYLEQSGYHVLTARDGQTGLTLARCERPDLMVLDIMLPGALDGLDVCRAIRRDSMLGALPIIMLTARVEETDRLIGLELGADDYITKPFSPREVVARVKAVLRRVRQDVGHTGVVRVGALEIDVPRRRVTVSGEPISLTPTEFDILAALAQHPGRPYTRAQLIERVYDTAYTGYDRAIDSHITNLRGKIEPDPRHPRYVVTVYGVGYKLEEPS